MNRTITAATALIVTALLAAGCAAPEPAVQQDEPTEQPEVDQQDEEEAEEEVAQQEPEPQPEPEPDPRQDDEGVIGKEALAEIYDADGELMGEVSFNQTQQGVLVDGRIETLEEGPRGFHVHEHGECDPPDFESAGGHFNPTRHPHGGPDDQPDERHAGDFGNIEFDADGVAEFTFVDDVVTLGSGTNDIIGQSLIVHYEEDDLRSQPVGDAGPRAGCGIIEAVDGPEGRPVDREERTRPGDLDDSDDQTRPGDLDDSDDRTRPGDL